MSRRPAPAASTTQRAAQNQQTIKTLLKIEGNKSCADCKRNKHPRWASWNLGIFVCIRCSGIHRGMGTHISRVKSVDLDAWTDEQLQSVLRWGNARANKYWEAKLADGHIPSEAKIENFIRTKYESKRWVMDGPMPDPASLDVGGDDDVPLNVVQEKAKLDRASSQRSPSGASQPAPFPSKVSQPIDLFGDLPVPPARPSTTEPSSSQPPPPKAVPVTKPTKASESLLGLDFFGGPTAPPSARPASTASLPSGTNGPSRPDLKQSILSLYASAPKSQPVAQPESASAFGGTQANPTHKPSSFGGLDDAFAGLTMTQSTTAPPKPAPSVNMDPFANFNSGTGQRSSAAPAKVTSPLSGGGFFDAGSKPFTNPTPTSKTAPKQAVLSPPESSDFGDFSFASDPAPAPSKPSGGAGASTDLFSLDNSPPQSVSAPKPTAPVTNTVDASPFNLSAHTAPAKPADKPNASAKSTSANFSAFSNADAWGSNDPWATPDPAPAEISKPKASNPAKAPAITMQNDFSAWGGSEPAVTNTAAGSNGFGSASTGPPKITPDEDFGGWSSSAPVATETSTTFNPAPATTKPSGGGFGGGEDLYSNVWG